MGQRLLATIISEESPTHEHHHSGIRYVTPAQRHDGLDAELLAARNHFYADANARHPALWSRTTRNWTPVGEVWLNPQTAYTNDDGRLLGA